MRQRPQLHRRRPLLPAPNRHPDRLRHMRYDASGRHAPSHRPRAQQVSEALCRKDVAERQLAARLLCLPVGGNRQLAHPRRCGLRVAPHADRIRLVTDLEVHWPHLRHAHLALAVAQLLIATVPPALRLLRLGDDEDGLLRLRAERGRALVHCDQRCARRQARRADVVEARHVGEDWALHVLHFDLQPLCPDLPQIEQQVHWAEHLHVNGPVLGELELARAAGRALQWLGLAPLQAVDL
eukprot:scaffold47916_cov36-Phaeocystis_antarctica.AAC.2